MVIQQRLTDRAGTTLPTVAAKGAEVLVFRPRLRPSFEPIAPQRPVRSVIGSRRATIIICGGCEFVVTAEMAGCFLARAHRVIDAGETCLVPLLHAGGVDLLLISVTTPLGVRLKESS